MPYYKNESAIVDKGAIVGKDTKIWHWSHICSGAKIGVNCSIGQNVYVASLVSIGDGVKIQNNVSIYDGVTLQDNVFCGPSVVFTNVINPRSRVSRKDEFRSTLIKEGASLGANSTIICGIVVGKYAFIGAGSLVTKDIRDYALMVGSPAIQVGWMSEDGGKIDLPLDSKGEHIIGKCPLTGDKYRLIDNKLCKK